MAFLLYKTQKATPNILGAEVFCTCADNFSKNNNMVRCRFIKKKKQCAVLRELMNVTIITRVMAACHGASLGGSPEPEHNSCTSTAVTLGAAEVISDWLTVEAHHAVRGD